MNKIKIQSSKKMYNSAFIFIFRSNDSTYFVPTVCNSENTVKRCSNLHFISFSKITQSSTRFGIKYDNIYQRLAKLFTNWNLIRFVTRVLKIHILFSTTISFKVAYTFCLIEYLNSLNIFFG